MTVCLAAICAWNYGEANRPPEWGYALITGSDRMFTVDDLGIEYEPNQRKMAVYGDRISILVADNVNVHSELIQSIGKDFAEDKSLSIKAMAEKYSQHLRSLKSKRAAEYVLSSYNMTADEFVTRQKEFDAGIAFQLAQHTYSAALFDLSEPRCWEYFSAIALMERSSMCWSNPSETSMPR